MLEILIKTCTTNRSFRIIQDHSGKMSWVSSGPGIWQQLGYRCSARRVLCRAHNVRASIFNRKAAGDSGFFSDWGWAMSSHVGLSHQEAGCSRSQRCDSCCSRLQHLFNICYAQLGMCMASAGRKEAQGTPGKDSGLRVGLLYIGHWNSSNTITRMAIPILMILMTDINTYIIIIIILTMIFPNPSLFIFSPEKSQPPSLASRWREAPRSGLEKKERALTQALTLVFNGDFLGISLIFDGIFTVSMGFLPI